MRKTRSYPQHNAEGYRDPTAYEAMKPVQTEQSAEEERLKRMIKTVKSVIDFAGFDLIERIQVQDKKSGKVYK